jgi:hypothetical protein
MISSPPWLPEVCRYLEQTGLGIEEEVQGWRFLLSFFILGKRVGIEFLLSDTHQGRIKTGSVGLRHVGQRLSCNKKEKGVYDDDQLRRM